MPELKAVQYLEYDHVRYIHLVLVDVFFSHFKDETARYGIIDDNAIHAAVNRPRQTFDGKELHGSLYEKAASVIHSLIKDHPFVDANKRTGVVSGWVFLAMNGILLSPEENQLYQTALNVESNTYLVPRLAKWLEKHSQEYDFSRHSLLETRPKTPSAALGVSPGSVT